MLTISWKDKVSYTEFVYAPLGKFGSDVYTGWMSKHKALTTDPNQWPGIIISSSTTRLLTEVAMHPSRQLSGASTRSTGIYTVEIPQSQCQPVAILPA